MHIYTIVIRKVNYVHRTSVVLQLLCISIVIRRSDSIKNTYDSMTYGFCFCDTELEGFTDVYLWKHNNTYIKYMTQCDQHA